MLLWIWHDASEWPHFLWHIILYPELWCAAEYMCRNTSSAGGRRDERQFLQPGVEKSYSSLHLLIHNYVHFTLIQAFFLCVCAVDECSHYLVSHMVLLELHTLYYEPHFSEWVCQSFSKSHSGPSVLTVTAVAAVLSGGHHSEALLSWFRTKNLIKWQWNTEWMNTHKL